jgi:hypothetical protein
MSPEQSSSSPKRSVDVGVLSEDVIDDDAPRAGRCEVIGREAEPTLSRYQSGKIGLANRLNLLSSSSSNQGCRTKRNPPPSASAGEYSCLAQRWNACSKDLGVRGARAGFPYHGGRASAEWHGRMREDEGAHACAALDLYTNTLFVGKRRWVEQTCDRWLILSAEHGCEARALSLVVLDRAL